MDFLTIMLAFWISIQYFRLGKRKRKNALLYGVYGFMLTIFSTLLISTLAVKFSGLEFLLVVAPVCGAIVATAYYFVVRK